MVDLTSPTRGMDMDDDDDEHRVVGGQQGTHVREVSRERSGNMNDAADDDWGGAIFTQRTLTAIQNARPLPDYPTNTQDIGEWKIQWEYAFPCHAYGVPKPYYQLDILKNKLPADLKQRLANLQLQRMPNRTKVTYSMFMDYLLARQTTNPFVGRTERKMMSGPTHANGSSLEDFRIR